MVAIQAEQRTQGKGNNVNQLRRKGWVPAVLYGEEAGNVSIQVKESELENVIRTNSINKPFSLHVNGQSYRVMVYELQRHPIQGKVLHADFKQINRNEKIHTSVPIVVTGSPEYGLVTLLHHAVEVSCLPDNIPEAFNVNVDGMQVGDTITLADLNIPENIEIGMDELEAIVKILAPQAAPVEDDEAEEGKADGGDETELA